MEKENDDTRHFDWKSDRKCPDRLPGDTITKDLDNVTCDKCQEMIVNIVSDWIRGVTEKE